MREKILAQLIAKHSGVSKKALGLIADKLAKKVTEEGGIDDAITGFDNAVGIKEFADDLQREGDSRVGEAKKEWEKKNPPKPAKTDEPTDDPKPAEDTPAWAKALLDKVDRLEREKAVGTNASKAEAALKDVPKSFWKGRTIPEKEDDLQAFIDSVTTDFTAFKQEQIDAGLMQLTPPVDGGGSGGKPVNDKAIEADIKSWANKGKPATNEKK